MEGKEKTGGIYKAWWKKDLIESITTPQKEAFRSNPYSSM